MHSKSVTNNIFHIGHGFDDFSIGQRGGRNNHFLATFSASLNSGVGHTLIPVGRPW